MHRTPTPIPAWSFHDEEVIGNSSRKSQQKKKRTQVFPMTLFLFSRQVCSKTVKNSQFVTFVLPIAISPLFDRLTSRPGPLTRPCSRPLDECGSYGDGGLGTTSALERGSTGRDHDGRLGGRGLDGGDGADGRGSSRG